MLLVYFAGLLGLTTLICHFYFRPRSSSVLYEGKHVVITGGSEGMGRELAKVLFQLGAKVTIMARTRSKLDQVKAELADIKRRSPGIPPSASIEVVPVDVTDSEAVEEAMKEAVTLQGGSRIRWVFLAAGRASPGYFLSHSLEKYHGDMELNYFGSLNCVKAVVPAMIEDDVESHIVFIGSACSTVSFFGYTSYAPSKHAIRGFADGLRNELRGFKIGIHISYPPDTETEGFERENVEKPKETMEISPPSLYSVKRVVDYILEGLSRDEYHLMGPDLVQNLLVSSSANITPRGRWAPIEIVLLPVISLICLGFKVHADAIAAAYGRAVLAKTRKI